MSNGQGNTYNGFLEGSVRQNGGDLDFLPFGDVGEATMIYNSENTIIETFSRTGIKGASSSCPLREELSFQVSSESITWNLLQIALNTRAEDNDQNLERSDTFTLTTVSGTEPNEVSTLVLPFAVSVAADVVVADVEGVQFDVSTSVDANVTTVTFDDDYTGQVVSVKYSLAPTGENNLIKVGQGAKLGEVGVYGRFKGCPDSLLVVVPRGIIQSELNLSAADGAASAGFTIQALRDSQGNYAYVQKI